MTIDLNITLRRNVLIEKYSIENAKRYFFISCLEGCETKLIDGDTSITYYVKNDRIFFEQDNKNKIVFCRFDFVWRVFERQFKMSYQAVQLFIDSMLIEFGLQGYSSNESSHVSIFKRESELKLNNDYES